ncbi:MAG: hypothetical protein HQM06_13970 [Magnetococcales bacterium]|nr:hypothetical protein [Magnetococcales bacterium]
MAQHGFNIGNQSGQGFRADVNAALQALVSQSSGASAPSTTYANMLWDDTANGVIKRRNQGNTAWIVVGRSGSPVFSSVTSGRTLHVSDYGGVFLCNGTFTMALDSAATLGDGWTCTIKNVGYGTITINPYSYQAIDGLFSIDLNAPYQHAVIVCDGSAFYVVSGLVSASIGLSNLKNGTANQLIGYNGSGVPTEVAPFVSEMSRTKFLHVTHSVSKNTAGGSSVAGWQVRQLNTIVTNTMDAGISLSGGEIVGLPANKNFYFEFSAVAYNVGHSSLFLSSRQAESGEWLTTENVKTNTSQEIIRGSGYLPSHSADMSRKFTLYQHTQSAIATNGLGLPSNKTEPAGLSDLVETYASMKVWQVS